MNKSDSKKEQKNTQETSSWMNHPDLSNMDAAKLAMLNSLAQQGAGKNPQELLPFLMSAASMNRSKGVKFSNQEIDTIIQVLKLGRPAAEVQRIERLLQMIRMIH